ncbi:unnamed protein product [Ilex paraguariensis]|uniref:Uncharacterized protein n=1 Tax=Ilex paraguariensis TaxID=185542 RepID=A0ABC8UPD9_9AQUA
MHVWELYERGKLVELVDSSLEGEYDVDEACRFLKIGLLCTQNMPKIRPSMSNVVKLLTGEMEVDDNAISEPGLIFELMGLRSEKHNTSNTLSSGLENLNNSSSSGNTNTSYATMTFTSIYDRST